MQTYRSVCAAERERKKMKELVFGCLTFEMGIVLNFYIIIMIMLG